ncbi:MAG: PaaI family thioesterase [Megasphaera sp.]|nr:PaaI family thioesterase [Megasphaera sp.]MCH4187587.1 PaaI family thioesterase [Megasphaera sp.]MCH4217868.1 PaaI family thioesterase [Megasphaera sp.]
MDKKVLEGLSAEQRRMYQIFERIYKNTPYFRNMPCTIEDLNEGHVCLSFDVKPELCNYRGIASGGVLAAFCDTLMGWASRTLGYQVTTLEINMNYIRQVAKGQHIIGLGEVIHHGGRTVVVSCELYDEEGNIVVKGRSSFYILKKLELD